MPFLSQQLSVLSVKSPVTNAETKAGFWERNIKWRLWQNNEKAANPFSKRKSDKHPRFLNGRISTLKMQLWNECCCAQTYFLCLCSISNADGLSSSTAQPGTSWGMPTIHVLLPPPSQMILCNGRGRKKNPSIASVLFLLHLSHLISPRHTHIRGAAPPMPTYK